MLGLVHCSVGRLRSGPEGRWPYDHGHVEGERLLAGWTAQAGQYRSLQGLAKVRVKTPQGSKSGAQVIIARSPDKLRAETLSPFGTTMLLLATDGSDLGVLVPSQNRFYFGQADAENIGRFTKVPVRPDDLVDALLYNSPILSGGKVTAFRLPDGGWLLELSSWGRRQELVFDLRRRLTQVRYFDGRDPVLTVTYGDFPDDGPVFPRRIALELFRYGVEASMEFSELELNLDPRSDQFRLEPPPHVETYDLDLVLYDSDRDGDRR